MDTPAKFRFLSAAEYAKLDLLQRQRYLNRSLTEVARRLAAVKGAQGALIRRYVENKLRALSV